MKIESEGRESATERGGEGGGRAREEERRSISSPFFPLTLSDLSFSKALSTGTVRDSRSPRELR